jgi:predicted PurR-regulated permease PerM
MLIRQKISSDNRQNKFSLLQYLQITFFIGLLFYFGKILFIPLFYGLFIAIVLYPVCKYLERKGWPKTIAITVCLLIVTILIAALVLLLILQVKAFTKDLPQLQPKISLTIQQLQQWLIEKFDISIATQAKWINNAPTDLKNNAINLIQGTLQATLDTLFVAFMVPVYTALFLYSRGTFIHFLQAMVGGKYKGKLQIILYKTIHTYHRYIKGMILVYLIVGTLNSIGLFALGVKHAILFGMLTAIMTIVPYIGIIVSALLPISLAWITTGSIWVPLAIVALFVFVQYLEANVIFPNVVGAQLNINTWATLVSIIAGGIIWGISGMILFIPFVAILKIIADDIDDWKPLRILLSRKD